jgi:hypothetical protein
MRVRHDPLRYGRREEGGARGVRQLPNGLLRTLVRGALPNQDKRPLRTTKQIGSFLNALVQGLVLVRGRIGRD